MLTDFENASIDGSGYPEYDDEAYNLDVIKSQVVFFSINEASHIVCQILINIIKIAKNKNNCNKCPKRISEISKRIKTKRTQQ